MYEHAEVLHEGPHNRVTRAWRLADRLPVVIKQLRGAWPGPRELARFRREYDMLASLDGAGAPKPIAFELHDESEGTRTWFRLIGPALAALDTGQLLIFDEIDASLHPRLSARLLELFQDPATNPNGAQLVFTTHDTSLLGWLNRDEVWLTEKDTDGATTITALADYGSARVRQSVNLERAYLQGRFGGVPELDQVALKSALGLVN